MTCKRDPVGAVARADFFLMDAGLPSYGELVSALKELRRTELFLQDHPQKVHAQQVARNVLAAADHWSVVR